MRKKSELTFLSVITVIALSLGLRLIRLTELFHFTYDEEIIAFVGKRMFVNGHIPLIGGVTPMHVHVAPYFYWLSGIFLYFSKLNPVGWGIVAAALSGLTMALLYKTGKDIFGKHPGLIAIAIYGFSFYQNLFDRHYWGLIFDGLLALGVFYSLFQVLRGKTKYLYITAASLAFGLHTDLSTLTLFLFTGIVLVYFRPRISQRTYFISLILILLSFLPLVIFDIRHNFSNSRGIVQYITEVKAGRKGTVRATAFDSIFFIPRTLARTLYIPANTDLAKQYSYCPVHVVNRLQSVPVVISVFILFILTSLFVIKGRNNSEEIGLKLLRVLFLSTVLGVICYGILFKGDLFEHYLATLFPIFYLLLAYYIGRLLSGKQLLIGTILVFYILANVHAFFLSYHSFGFSDKERAVRWAIATTGNTDFALDVIGDCYKYNGYRYLFYIFGKEPTKSYVDANFTHLFDKPPAFVYPPLLAVITNADDVESSNYYTEYDRYKTKLLTSARFGKIEVLIVDNRNLDFTGKF